MNSLKFKLSVLAIASLALQGCNGIFDGIYDEPAPIDPSDAGFTEVTGTNRGIIRVDATSYTDWVYIDLHNRKVEVAAVSASAPREWDFAVHRYDARTNGGTVAETDARTIDNAASINTSTLSFLADEWTEDVIVTDMSTMADGYLTYAPSYYSRTLSLWLDVDKSTMPPVYAPSEKVYILRLADGTSAALRLDSFMDAAGVKGNLTISYVYPL